jgi:hypothetical protein
LGLTAAQSAARSAGHPGGDLTPLDSDVIEQVVVEPPQPGNRPTGSTPGREKVLQLTQHLRSFHFCNDAIGLPEAG